MIVIPGPASPNLGKEIANILKSKIVPVISKIFPDGEIYIRINGEVRNQEVVIVQTTGPPQNIHIMQLVLMVNTVKDLGAKKVTAVVPYLAYARQDKRFLQGEAVSAKVVLKMLETFGVDRFLTINVHETKILEEFRGPTVNLSAMELLAEHFVEKDLKEAFSLAPDMGAIALAREADKILNGGCGWLRKQRDLLTGEICMEEKRFNIKGRDVIVFDDIISTGGTITAALEMLKRQGVKRVYAACAHPLLVGEAQRKIMQSGAAGIVGTDCIPGPLSVVSVAPLIVDALVEWGI